LDAAIIGGGPAGAAAAISLRQLAPEATIAIFDAASSDGWRTGETLAPGAESILDSLGVLAAFHQQGFVESFGTRAVWGSPQPAENDFLFGLRGRGWRLDRARFDAMLREQAAAAGVEVRRGWPLTESDGEAGNWRLSFHGGECEARFVIDASGRAARFAVDRGARRFVDDRLAGVVVRYDGGQHGDTLVEAAECGWWYSVSVPGGSTVAAFMTDSDLIRETGLADPACWDERLSASTLTGQRLHGAVALGPPSIFTAHSQYLTEVAGPGWVAAGDAAMAFDPLSSQGILKALRSGKLASFVAADFLNRGAGSHERYQDIARAEYAAYHRTKLDYYGQEQRWPESEFWKRRR
jgi:flavin-dependent dehydrogenase